MFFSYVYLFYVILFYRLELLSRSTVLKSTQMFTKSSKILWQILHVFDLNRQWHFKLFNVLFQKYL